MEDKDFNWRDGQEEVNFKDYGCSILNERHHLIYGRPWALGRDYYNFLRENILITPESKVLDFGCGVGRVGVCVLSEQSGGEYIGIEKHSESLYLFEEYEIPLHGLESKNFTLSDSSFLDMRGQSQYQNFDLILDFYSTFHILGESSEKEVVEYYRAFSSMLNENGVIVLAHDLHIPEFELEAIGLKVKMKTEHLSPILTKFNYRKNFNTFVVLEKFHC